MKGFSAFFCGLIFGAGLSVSGMINPAKVLNFLDIGGTWDPSLLLVMAAAVLVTFVGYKIVFGFRRPLFEETFALPSKSRIDAKLLLGAAVFGIGWGVGGYCPGPALAGLLLLPQQGLVFVAAMVIGMIAGRIVFEANERS